ncbi:acyl carrier protein [Enterobacteriaceae endosymbiont of Donacia versicolorea]|uniref:acyl carrier protein n=1 Tax=Enterobacteriaceae endosymbiont of Donacia versicolorea TaxID=2675788 RepID=UPI001449F8E7|nr:acyl carrier protein [Enterobacteriaceae endosymbiont of Donacia versicolorea]QJC31962.1 acyl carrier protein [Enterobacteriaceae endosymbiont of Donacia versicolorea]
MNKNNSIIKRVKKVIANVLEIKEKNIKNDTSFKDLNVDSLETIEIIMSLEEEFNIEISDEDTEKITSIQEVINYINNYENQN